MKLAIAILSILGIGAFLYERGRAKSRSEGAFVVSFDDSAISVVAPDGQLLSVRWADLTQVGIRTTDEGPWADDLFWGLHVSGDPPAVAYPGGATGAPELLKAMQERLRGFRDEEVVKAMGSTSNAFFLAWQRPPSEGAAEDLIG